VSVVEAEELGRRYRNTWALRDCSLDIPEGHLVAVVGPNGAGKSTLLNLVVGLSCPSAGRITVLNGHPAGSRAALDGIAFVAQDMSVYRHLSVGDMLHMTRNLNLRFDTAYARARLSELGIGTKQRAGRLSGGQQAQLSLTLALARHPRLLVLDEPTASLDPLARHDFMRAVLTAMADDGVSVVLSSHILAELERFADYLVLLSHGHVRLQGTVEDILAAHRLVTGPAGRPPSRCGWEVIESSGAVAQSHQVVRLASADAPLPPGYQIRAVGIEELTLAYLREGVAQPAPTLAGTSR
jgi:ABC-2 type transport system ATP-binding protein